MVTVSTDRRERPPWYFEAAKTFGVPMVLLVAMIVWAGTVQDRKLDTLIARLDVVQQKIDTLATDSARAQQALLYMTFRVCLNTSKTENERAGCVLPGQAR